MRVLLIRGYRPLVKALELALEEEGFAADVAASGQEADDRVRTGRYDAVVLDQIVPRGGARGLVERWRRSSPATRVLLLTAPGSAGDADSGADGSLSKPFGLDEFLACLRGLTVG
jgi:two-component system OmpR family response regulator